MPRRRRAIAPEIGASGATTPSSPAELAARLDRLLACAGALVASVPMPYLEHRAASGGKTLGDLAFHLFRSALAFADGMDLGRLPAEWLAQPRPPDLQDGEAVGRYGALVRGRIAGWFEGAGPGEYLRMIRLSDGPRSGHALLEQTIADAASALTELYDLVGGLGITPPAPLPVADLGGLPSSKGAKVCGGESRS